MSDTESVEVRFGPDGLEAEYWLDHFAGARSEDLGEAIARHQQVGEAVLSALNHGAKAGDVIAALEMAGRVQRVTRIRDRLPFLRAFGVRHASTRFEVRASDTD